MGRTGKLINYPIVNEKLIALLKAHLNEGYSYGSFSGRYRIRVEYWQQMTKVHKELREINEKYLDFRQDQRRKVRKYSGNFKIN